MFPCSAVIIGSDLAGGARFFFFFLILFSYFIKTCSQPQLAFRRFRSASGVQHRGYPLQNRGGPSSDRSGPGLALPVVVTASLAPFPALSFTSSWLFCDRRSVLLQPLTLLTHPSLPSHPAAVSLFAAPVSRCFVYSFLLFFKSHV